MPIAITSGLGSYTLNEVGEKSSLLARVFYNTELFRLRIKKIVQEQKRVKNNRSNAID